MRESGGLIWGCGWSLVEIYLSRVLKLLGELYLRSGSLLKATILNIKVVVVSNLLFWFDFHLVIKLQQVGYRRNQHLIFNYF